MLSGGGDALGEREARGPGVSKTFRVRGLRRQDDTLLNVLRRLSFDVYEGEVVSLIGESACGKTTLLRIVQGPLEIANSGLAPNAFERRYADPIQPTAVRCREAVSETTNLRSRVRHPCAWARNISKNCR